VAVRAVRQILEPLLRGGSLEQLLVGVVEQKEGKKA
jgi:hypothetical protein